ncbi:MAG: hypothetical protein ACOC4M_17810, partial [Promethearchaeia archaeon]
FNSVWTLPKPQYHALAAGSELKIELKDGIDIDISYLENTFYGLRRSEGYGQIKVNWHHHDKVQKARLPKVRIDLPHNLVKIADFIEFCLFQNLKYKLKEKAHEQASEFYRRRSDLPSSSFFYRIKAIIENTNDFKELGELFNNIFHKEKYLADGKEHKVSKQFREKLNTIITGLKYSKGEPGPEGNYLTNFKEFVSMLNNLNVIESNTFLRNTLIPKLSDKVSVTYYKEENERLFMLYTLYCKIFLKDVLNKLK